MAHDRGQVRGEVPEPTHQQDNQKNPAHFHGF
jgi:hypothetical protein